MKAVYKVEVNMKRGFSPLTERRVETAVHGCEPTHGSIRNVAVAMSIEGVDVMFQGDLFAYGEKRGERWVLIDFFTTAKKAENAAARARERTKSAFGIEGIFAVFKYSPRTSVWIMA